MNLKPSAGRLARAAALGALLSSAAAFAPPAFAQAPVATAPPAPPAASTDAKLEALEAEIGQLQAEVQTLKAQQPPQRTDSQAALPRAEQNATGQINLPAQGQSAETGVAEPRVTQNSQNRFALTSANGEYSIGLTGDIQIDAGAYHLEPASPLAGPQELSNGVNARRARIGVTGTAPGGWAFALVWDAGNSQDTAAKGIETAQIVYGGIKGLALEAGYSNTFFTLDQSTSSNDSLFLERSSASNVATNFNAGDARTNLGFRWFGDRYWVGGYLTGPASGDSHTLTAERFGAFQRVAVQALKGPDYSLHLGVGVDELLQAPNSGNGTANALSLSDQPELRIDPTTFLNTSSLGTLANPVRGGHVLDLETAATWRNFYWQGEYYAYQVERQGLATANFNGAYGQVAWIITGETHAYNPQAASYFRVKPAHDFSLKDGTWGAWEVAARWDYANLNSNFFSGESLSANPAAVDGGLQRGVTVGVNWYPTDLVRFLLDYEHIDYSKAEGAAVKGLPLGSPIGDKIDAVALRSQVAF